MSANQRMIMMMDGTPLYDYLRDAVPESTPMDEWTKGYEECRRRLFKIIGPQLDKLANEPDECRYPQPGEMCLTCGASWLTANSEHNRPWHVCVPPRKEIVEAVDNLLSILCTGELPRTGAYAPEATCRHSVHPYDCREGCDPHSPAPK